MSTAACHAKSQYAFIQITSFLGLSYMIFKAVILNLFF